MTKANLMKALVEWLKGTAEAYDLVCKENFNDLTVNWRESEQIYDMEFWGLCEGFENYHDEINFSEHDYIEQFGEWLDFNSIAFKIAVNSALNG